MKLVFIGGHHNSALALALAMKNEGHLIYWFGHKHTMKKEKSLSAEYLEVVKNKIPFFEIKTGKFYSNNNILKYIKIFFGFIQSLFLLLKVRPNLIVSFGGYLSVPVVFAGFVLGIPGVSHEQTTQIGLANKVISGLVKLIFITWKDSLAYFSPKKTQLVGLPLANNFFKISKQNIFKNNLPTIFIVGGKQGSQLINKTIEEIMPKLLISYNLIHQTGKFNNSDDFKRLSKKRDCLPIELKKRYIIKRYFYTNDMIKLLKSSNLVVSRAGAHIIYELCVLSKPAVLIPISWASNNEQYKNALMLKKQKMAKIILENELTGDRLFLEINDCINNLKSLQKNALKAKSLVKKDAVKKMVQILEKNFK